MFDDESIVEYDDVAEETLGLTDKDPFDHAILDDIEMEWTDEGETVLRPVDPDAEVVYLEEGDDGSAEATGQPKPDGAASSAEADPWEERYKNLQSWSDRVQTENQKMKETVARLEGRVDEIGKPTEGTQDADTLDDVDLSDPVATKAWLKEEVERGVKATIEEILPNAQQIRVDNETSRELQHIIANRPDFMQYMPAIHRFYQQFPNTTASYEEAYQIVKTFVKPTAAQPPSKTTPPQGETPGNQSPQPSPSAESQKELREKAARLRTEQGVHSSETALGGGEVENIQDAMVMAADELYE